MKLSYNDLTQEQKESVLSHMESIKSLEEVESTIGNEIEVFNNLEQFLEWFFDKENSRQAIIKIMKSSFNDMNVHVSWLNEPIAYGSLYKLFGVDIVEMEDERIIFFYE